MPEKKTNTSDQEAVILEGKDYSRSQIRKKVLALAWPAIVEMFLHTFKHIMDSAMVGRLGEAEIASVGLSMSPMMLFMGFFAAIGIGSTAVVARFVGAKERDQANKAGQQSLLLSIGSALIITVLVFVLARNIITFMGAEPHVIPLGTTYMRTISLALVFMSTSFIMSGVLRGAGDTKSPMRVNATTNVCNVILNYFLIFETRTVMLGSVELMVPGAGLGVFGAALGTGISRMIGSIIILIILFKGKSVIKLYASKMLEVDLELMKRIVRIGIPAAVERLVMSSGQVMFNRIVASLGTTAYAAHHLAIMAESVSFMPGFGFSMAATTLVGQGLGAKDPELSEKCAYETWRLGLGVMSFMGVIFFVFPYQFMSLLTHEPEVITLGAMCLRIVALAQPPFATAIVLSGAIRGAGDTKFPMYASIVGVWVIRLSLALLLGVYLEMGLFGVWLAMATDLYARGILFFFRFRSGYWKDIKV